MKFKYIKKKLVRVESSSNNGNGTKFAEFILSNTSAAAEDNTAESACTELQCCSAAVHRGSISCQSGIREILKLKSKCFCGTKFPPPSSCSSANFVRALIDRSKMWRKSFVCWRIYRNCVIQRLLYFHFLLGITSMMNPTKVDILLGLWCSKLNLFKFLNYLL